MLHIFTLTWNGLPKLEKLTRGLIDNLHEAHSAHDTVNCLWHVRDNGSKDGTVEEISQWFEDGSQMRVHDIGHNRASFAEGMNFLFEKAEPKDDDFILLLNNDVSFGEDDALKKMFDLQKMTDAAVVGTRLLYNSSNKLQPAGVIFGEKYGRMPYHFKHQEESDANTKKNRYFQAVTAAVCLVRAKEWREVGGMDEGFRWAFEDIDLCLSIGELGGKVAYCGDSKIFHDESASLKKNPVNKMFLQPNIKHFKEKWFGKYELDHEKYLKDPAHNEIK